MRCRCESGQVCLRAHCRRRPRGANTTHCAVTAAGKLASSHTACRSRCIRQIERDCVRAGANRRKGEIDLDMRNLAPGFESGRVVRNRSRAARERRCECGPRRVRHLRVGQVSAGNVARAQGRDVTAVAARWRPERSINENHTTYATRIVTQRCRHPRAKPAHTRRDRQSRGAGQRSRRRRAERAVEQDRGTRRSDVHTERGRHPRAEPRDISNRGLRAGVGAERRDRHEELVGRTGERTRTVDVGV